MRLKVVSNILKKMNSLFYVLFNETLISYITNKFNTCGKTYGLSDTGDQTKQSKGSFLT